MGNEVKFIVSAETRQAAAALQNFFSTAVGGLARVAGPLAALVSAGGFAALARQSLAAADAMGKAAQLAGATATEFTGMAYAADRDEVDLGSLRVALKELSNELSKTGQGSKNLKEALLEQADIFARMPDGIEKNNQAVRTFGRAGLQLIPFLNQGSQSMQEMFERGERLTGINDDLAKSADEFNDALKDMHIAAVGLAGALVSSFIPALTRTINSITEGVVKFREWTKESESFKISVQAIGVSLGALAAFKVGSFAATGLSAILGVGGIRSLADFIAGLKLLPLAASGAAIALARLSGVVAALVLALKSFNAINDFLKAWGGEEEATKSLVGATEALTAALRRRIEADREAGKISEEEYQALQKRINAARLLTNQTDAAVALRGIASSQYPAGAAPEQRAPLTKEEYDQLRLTDDLATAQWRLDTAMDGVKINRRQLAVAMLAENATLRENLKFRRELTAQAEEDGAITALERKQADLEDQKTLVALLQEELALKGQIIDSDFSKTDAEKYRAKSAAGIPQEGPDPDSFTQNLSAQLAQLQNAFGTFSQASAGLLTSGLGTAIQGVSDGIMGLIDGTKSWAQAWGTVLRSMAAQGIQFIVGQTAMFLINKAKELVFHQTAETTKTVATVTNAKVRGQAYASEGLAAGFGAAAAGAGSVASIPYVGAALAVAAFAEIMATMTTAFALVSAVNAASFAEGGYTGNGGKYQPMGIVHAGEVVYSQSDIARHGGVGNVEAVRLAGPQAVVGQGANSPVIVNTIVVNDVQAAISAALKMPANQQTIIQTVDGRRLDLGLDS